MTENPTITTEAAVADVAAKLTEAQRVALRDELFALRSGVGRIRNQLIKKGLVHPGGTVNDRGLAVRQHLEQGATAGVAEMNEQMFGMGDR